MTPDEEDALWQRFAAGRDASLRNQLIELHLGLCRSIASALYARRGAINTEFVDYLQLATLGLIAAVDRYDPARGTPFVAFAAARIRGSVLNGLSELSERYEQISLRQRLRDERMRLASAPSASGSGPRDLFGDLAEAAIGLALGYLLEGTALMVDEAGAAQRHEFYAGVEARELRERLGRLVDALPERERRVIRYHYYQGLSFTEIAELLQLTKGRISQLHQQALQQIRAARGGGSVDLRA